MARQTVTGAVGEAVKDSRLAPNTSDKPVNLFVVAERPKDAVIYAPEAKVLRQTSENGDVTNADALPQLTASTTADQNFFRGLLKDGNLPATQGLKMFQKWQKNNRPMHGEL